MGKTSRALRAKQKSEALPAPLSFRGRVGSQRQERLNERACH